MTFYNDTGSAVRFGTGSVLRFLARIGRGILDFVVLTGRARGWQQEIETLQAKSDAELAAMGLARTDIPRHVFRNAMDI